MLIKAESAHVMNIMGGALFFCPFFGRAKKGRRNCIKAKAEKLLVGKKRDKRRCIFGETNCIEKKAYFSYYLCFSPAKS
jgi:hypothetical protein